MVETLIIMKSFRNKKALFLRQITDILVLRQNFLVGNKVDGYIEFENDLA